MSTSNKKLIAIVDAYSGARQYPYHARQLGFDCLHVQSTADIPAGYRRSFNPDDFIANIINEGEIDAVVDQLRRYPIACLFAGIESGVELADQLSERLGLVSNGTKLSEARRDKFKMAQAVQRCGLRIAKQFCTKDVDAILQWTKTEQIKAVVIKPLKSAGTDHVSICSSPSEIIESFHNIYGCRNQLGIVNNAVLAQEFIDGTEYIVNSMSSRTEHFFLQIWQYKKKTTANGRKIYDTSELLSGAGAIEKQLIEYTGSVLNALKIDNGPAHAEIMIDKQGPVLIEIGARIDGANIFDVDQECVGYGQARLIFDAFLNPDKMSQEIPRCYQARKWALAVFLISNQSGTIRSLDKIERIKSLPSFRCINLKVGAGSKITQTIDLFTSPGHLFLVHEDKKIMESDYQQIRAMEEAGLFGVD